ncbi:DNA-directed RNA polymerase I subunit RPA43 [Daldinia childiae]|uniref:DNA-directed RNA polymerase I subunit RPA43 n=1 Tax=Daldinia childiae TaxID=326645 RepID=UPI00144772D7|nr:DNA-directed RNA polymerase I subunit RPA43 [Daldinia childiae]KAF3058592.1 DNA-directed RNA polymerase I subunit RPA43 [Daldinia childiae]
MADNAASTLTSPSDKKLKSHKKHKRHREADGTEGNERKHKKSKSSSNSHAPEPEDPIQIETKLADAIIPETEANGNDSKAGKKKKRPRHKDRDQTTEKTDEHQIVQNGAVGGSASKKDKKKSKEHKKKHDKINIEESVIPDSQPVPTAQDQETEDPEPDSMDIDSVPAETSNSDEFGQKPAASEYPFFTQTVSQYPSLFPSGLIEPIEGFADQHLRPLLNRYVPSFRGVLLAYRNPRVGEAPGRGSLTEESKAKETVLLESINEYAVAFGWLTVDVDIFRPSRGVSMEGIVNLQGEGHIGVVCWDMFNASIEAARLPHGWRWVDLLSKDKDKGKDRGKGKKADREKTAEEAKLPTPEPFDNPEDDTTQMHTTGYWVDETGKRIRGGAKIYFRIKHYEVGISGDYGYLSIEGTMLTEEEEKVKNAEEMEVLRRRRLKHGGVLRKEQKRLPEFSMTKFGVNETEDNETQRAPVQQVLSRPGSDTE